VARLQDLLAKKVSLDREIEKVQKEERSAAIEHIRTLMEQYGLVASDLAGRATGRRGRPAKTGTAASKPTARKGAQGKRSSTLKGKKVAIKFRNKASGETWTGRGLQPRWLREAVASGKKLADYAV
jgi:DNA-binding protein H-NS